MGLAGKSVIVTGAAHGIGLAVARRFVKAGASVMMADRDEDKLDLEVATLTEQGWDGRAQGFFGDLRERLTVANLLAATMDAHDGVDVLINASRLVVPSQPLDPDGDKVEESFNRNVGTTLRLTQLVARRMIELGQAAGDSGGRTIVNVSSVMALRAPPEMLAYSVSCAALDQLTRTLAAVLAPHGIRVNAVAVGGVLSHALSEALGGEDAQERLEQAVPLGRLGEPAEVAEAALYLASPAASFVTGQILAVDGGRLLLDPLSTTAR